MDDIINTIMNDKRQSPWIKYRKIDMLSDILRKHVEIQMIKDDESKISELTLNVLMAEYNMMLYKIRSDVYN